MFYVLHSRQKLRVRWLLSEYKQQKDLPNSPGKCRNNTGHVSYEQLKTPSGIFTFWETVQQPFHYYVFICMSSDYNSIAYEISCKIRLVLTWLCKIRGNYFKKNNCYTLLINGVLQFATCQLASNQKAILKCKVTYWECRLKHTTFSKQVFWSHRNRQKQKHSMCFGTFFLEIHTHFLTNSAWNHTKMEWNLFKISLVAAYL